MVSVRTVLVSLGIAFTAYLAARGLLWTGGSVEQPVVLVVAFLLYLITTLLCLFVNAPRPDDVDDAAVTDDGSRRAARLPRWVSALAVV
ncbi:MAG: hypothetical protein J0I66_08645, partial [Microbacterium sp.]|nr:hypothetical protein [Microbacterium sp.]